MFEPFFRKMFSQKTPSQMFDAVLYKLVLHEFILKKHSCKAKVVNLCLVVILSIYAVRPSYLLYEKGM